MDGVPPVRGISSTRAVWQLFHVFHVFLNLLLVLTRLQDLKYPLAFPFKGLYGAARNSLRQFLTKASFDPFVSFAAQIR